MTTHAGFTAWGNISRCDENKYVLYDKIYTSEKYPQARQELNIMPERMYYSMHENKVSIYCVTYNHAAYIREALDGFLMQKTNFNFNILIFDDASTDGTSDIVREYQKKYPDIIYAYISPVNTYGKPERMGIMNALYDQYLTGEYIAWCEGDDAWTCEDKLQMQVDFLEKNTNCLMTTHAYKWINYAENEAASIHLFPESCYVTQEKAIIHAMPLSFMAAASLVMRKKVFFCERDGFPKCPVGDFPRELYALYHGDIYYFNNEMSIYRYMHEGSWSKKQHDNFEKGIYHGLRMIIFLMRYHSYSKKQFRKPIWGKMASYFYGVAELLCEASNPKEMIQNVSEKSNHIYDPLMKEIIAEYEWMSGHYQMDNQMEEMIAQYEHICVMGKGKYSKFIVNVLEKSEIKYDGFLLSKKEEGSQDPNVWDVLDFPYDKEKTLIIIGISQIHEDSVVKTLKEYDFKNVWCPLWFNDDICRDKAYRELRQKKMDRIISIISDVADRPEA